MVICLERGANLHTAQMMPLPLTVSCSSKILVGFTFLVPAHLGSPGQRAIKQACVRVSESFCLTIDKVSDISYHVVMLALMQQCPSAGLAVNKLRMQP